MSSSDNSTPHKADEYDRSVRQTIPFYEAIQSETIDLIRTIKPGASYWLDTGCGTGYLVEMAMPYFPRTGFVLADPSISMLNQAQSRFAGLPEKRLKILTPTSSENLNLYLNEIHPQVITAVLSHHYLQNSKRREATQVCYRLLEQDGVFVTVENITPGTEYSISIGLNRWKHFQLEQGRAQSVVEDHAKRFNSNYFPISIKDHLDLLHEMGFKDVNLFWLSHMQAGFYAVK